jgi:hypothetical protein
MATHAATTRNISGLARALAQHGLMSEHEAESHQTAAAQAGVTFVEKLLEGKRITPAKLALFASRAFGVPLMDLSAFDAEGNFLWRRIGNDLIQRDWRLFFGDRERFENNAGDVEESISSPVAIARPGEKGFLATSPEYDCEQMMTELSR